MLPPRIFLHLASLSFLYIVAGASNRLPERQSSHEAPVYNTRFPGLTWDNDRWILSTTVFNPGHYQSRMPSANGYLGISLAASGPFYEFDVPVDGDDISGWPLFNRRQTFATVSGFFDEQPTTNGTNFPWLQAVGGESVISGIPHWGGIIVVLANGQYLDATVNPNAISNFSSSLDFKQGLSTWQYTWTPEDSQGLSFTIRYSLYTNKLFVNQAVTQLQIEPSQACSVSIVNILDGRNAVRTAFAESGVDGDQIFTAVYPSGVPNVTAYLYATMQATPEVNMSTLTIQSDAPYIGVNDSTIAQAATAYLTPGQVTTVTKFVGGASSDGFSDPKGQAKNATLDAISMGYDQSLVYHVAEWRRVMPDDTVDNYAFPENGTLPSDANIIESQITSVASTYYLVMNTVGQLALSLVDNAPIDKNSISVSGLSSDSYGGLIFWDAEVWMQPGFVVAFPFEAQQIAKYRVATYGQALANVKTAYTSSKNRTIFSEGTAVYPWTSARYGNCTGDGPCWDYEEHINSDIFLEFKNYWVASGDTDFFEQELLPIMESIALFESELVAKNGTNYVLTNMTDPDEYANNVDNGAFTMASISTVLTYTNIFRELFGEEGNATYDVQAENVLIPKDPTTGITLEYTGMNGSISVKQADVVLNTFPLSFSRNYNSADSLRDLDYYASKQSSSGPGMTFAIFSIVASQVSLSGCSSYTYHQYSSQPYTRGWFQFSEQLNDNYQQNGGTHPAFPFLTGHGGVLQVAVYGYLGLRLEPDFMLHINPTLPPQIPYLRYRKMYHHGWPYRATSNQSHTTITRLPKPLDTANSTFATCSFPVVIAGDNTTYYLPPNGTLVIPNRSNCYAKTVPGNIAQCLPVSSPDAYEPGQIPLSAVDGAASTKWQPSLANVSQSMTVDLSSIPITPIANLYFDWAQNPPINATVVFHNNSHVAPTDIVLVLENITISAPYDAAMSDVIAPYTSNRTVFELENGVWSGRYATLTVEGNRGDGAANATGASVAEWAIVAAG